MNRKDWRSVNISDVNFTINDLKQDLLPLIKRTGLPEGTDASVHWTVALVQETRKLLTTLLPFTKTEKEFLDRLLDYGEIESSLLTDDPQLGSRIREHPSLRWKAFNVRQFKKR